MSNTDFKSFKDEELLDYAADMLDRAWEKGEDKQSRDSDTLESIAASLLVIARNSLPIEISQLVEDNPS